MDRLTGVCFMWHYQKETASKAPTMPGVILSVVLTLSVQAVVSMSAVAIPVFMPVAAGELNVPPSYVGIFMSLEAPRYFEWVNV